jgi:uncharacterized protein YndB with AHSA1/START domain
MAKWLPPHGFVGKVHRMDAKVGGSYKMSFTNFGTGETHSFGGKFEALVPGKRLRYTDEFERPSLPGKMRTTVSLKKVSCGTELNVVQAGIPAVIPVEACYLALRIAHPARAVGGGGDQVGARPPTPSPCPLCQAGR